MTAEFLELDYFDKLYFYILTKCRVTYYVYIYYNINITS